MSLSRAWIASAVAAAGLAIGAPGAVSQVSIGVNVGPPPVCPYGYYDYAPYNCAPYGYYGPQWFANGAFIGAGPWFRGPANFYGPIDNRYDPRFGYHGPFPDRGDRRFDHFHGNGWRDGRGHMREGGFDHGNHGDDHGGDHGDHRH